MICASAGPDGAKKHVRGTHRVVAPSVTVARWTPHLPSLGITRVADVTGLDCIGIPTIMVVRPNARSLSVSQGKGVDLDSAKASGIMESVEQFHAEHIHRPLRLATAAELGRSETLLPLEGLPRFVKDLSPGARILWIEGTLLAEDRTIWVPYELVNLDFTLPLPEGSGRFTSGSNGLASGNHLLEAIHHGLCEVIERDALALFYGTPPPKQREQRVDLTTVQDEICASLLAKFEQAAIEVAVWDATSDLGVPTFLCQILERPEECLRIVGMARGSGCHPDPNVALSRALCEAAQSRLTRIVGSRDDMQREHVAALRSQSSMAEHRALMADLPRQPLDFAPIPNHATSTLDEDIRWLLDRLATSGLPGASFVNLSRSELPGFVAKVIVPGLEGVAYAPGSREGPRLRAHRRKFECA